MTRMDYISRRKRAKVREISRRHFRMDWTDPLAVLAMQADAGDLSPHVTLYLTNRSALRYAKESWKKGWRHDAHRKLKETMGGLKDGLRSWKKCCDLINKRRDHRETSVVPHHRRTVASSPLYTRLQFQVARTLGYPHKEVYLRPAHIDISEKSTQRIFKKIKGNCRGWQAYKVTGVVTIEPDVTAEDQGAYSRRCGFHKFDRKILIPSYDVLYQGKVRAKVRGDVLMRGRQRWKRVLTPSFARKHQVPYSWKKISMKEADEIMGELNR